MEKYRCCAWPGGQCGLRLSAAGEWLRRQGTAHRPGLGASKPLLPQQLSSSCQGEAAMVWPAVTGPCGTAPCWGTWARRLGCTFELLPRPSPGGTCCPSPPWEERSLQEGGQGLISHQRTWTRKAATISGGLTGHGRPGTRGGAKDMTLTRLVIWAVMGSGTQYGPATDATLGPCFAYQPPPACRFVSC